MLAELRVGPILAGDGTTQPQRASRTGATISADGHARYYELTLRGQVFTIQVKTATVTATTDISPLPATTGRGLVGLINPPTSGRNAVILKIGMSTVSGTPGGPFYIDVLANCGATLTPGTVPVNNLTLAQSGSFMRGIAAAVPAQTAVAIMLRPLGGLAAVAVGAGLYHVEEEVAGSIVIPPGGLIAITAHATGTSHVVSGYITYAEEPI
jgi:hypothetical protein